MGSASFAFVGFSLLVVLVFNLSRALAWRQAILLLASLCFLATFSHSWLAFVPFACFLAFGFLSVRALQSGTFKRAAPFLIAGIGAFIWLKKYTVLPSASFLQFSYITIGLSYVFFRVLHLIIDASDGALPDRIGVVSYLNYTLNFATLISGPIQRYQDFAADQLAPTPRPIDIIIVGEAIERIIVGFFKVNVVSLLLSMAQGWAQSALNPATTLRERTLYGVVIAASYPFYLYCNFSGYIDIVIGVARLLRLQLPENFNRPFSSDNFLNFWSRWHITLSEWLKTYVYNPLLISLMRKFPSQTVEPFLAVFAFFVTFFLIGVWHGRTSVFLFFGVLQGLGVSLTKLYQIVMAKSMGRKRYKALAAGPVYNALARGLTFTWFTFTLLWFWSNWTQIGAINNALGVGGFVAVWLAIFLGATLILQLWETSRAWLLSLTWSGSPVLMSRYFRTVSNTALLLISVAVVELMNAPAPDIVYKAF